LLTSEFDSNGCQDRHAHACAWYGRVNLYIADLHLSLLMSAWEIEVNQSYVELLGQWGMLIMSFYFGGRTLEKILA
jgi:hypothetical protein